MAILQGDIKLLESQVMQDVEEGGGAPTANVIVDAEQNNIFPDISEAARAGGRVYMRKVHVSVQTDNRDTYMDANVIVAEPPEDPNVSVTIFSTGETFDRREDAANRIESYLIGGGEWPALLFGDHVEGQRIVQLFQRVSVAPPPVGRTLKLVKNEGTGTEFAQYVRVTSVDVTEMTFTYNDDQDYQALVVDCEISDGLRADFPGSEANRLFQRESGATIIRNTLVADASNYYSTRPLTVDAGVGDVGVTVDSVFTQLVPNARTETSVVDKRPAADFSRTLATTPRAVTVAGSPLNQRVKIGQENRSFNYVTIMSPLPAPGSVRVEYRALDQSYSLTDNGSGQLEGAGSGTINYTTGSVAVTLQAMPDDRSAVVFYWGQNTAYTNRAGHTELRPPEFSFGLEHDGVVPGSVEITWESGGVTKTATANAAGVLSGDATGDVNHNAGLVHIKPTAMPDPGAEFSISYDWRTMVEEAITSVSPDGTGSVAFTLAQTPVAGTISVKWLTTRLTSESSGSVASAGSTTKTNSSSSSTTVTSGKMQQVVPDKTYWESIPQYDDAVTRFDGDDALMGIVGYLRVERVTPGYTYEYGPDYVSLTTSRQASNSNGSSYTQTSKQTSRNGVTVAHMLTDDGAGGFYGALGTVGYVSKAVSVKVVGDFSENSYDVNYERASDFEALNATSEPTETIGQPGGSTLSVTTGGGGSATAKGGTFGSSSFSETFGNNTMRVRYATGSPTPTAATDSYTPPEVSIDLLPRTKDFAVPNSLRFTWMGVAYDDFEGVIYRGRTESNPGIASGVINYSTGIVKMTDYVVGPSPQTVTINSLWTIKKIPETANVVFNTVLAPVKPTGLVMSVVDITGTQLLGTADLSGNITGPHMHGKIEYETGLVEIQFGDYVLDSSLTAAQKAEPWYDADDVRTSDDKIWRPWPVDLDSLRYAQVAFFYLPLDADLLGLDPVRLPQDGKVPIYRPGGFVVVGNKKTITATVSNGQTINCARVRLSRVRVIGNDGNLINTGYTADLEAGTVTFTNVSGYSQPVTVEHRIEDMAVVATVQITGQLALTRALTHNYDAGESYVSSALMGGDLRSRVSTVFDQVSWTGVWSDTPIGTSAAATYDDINHPMVVTNKGAVTERWYAQFQPDGVSYKVFGEHLGLIGTGNTSTEFAPNNPATGEPYFTIPALGWGGGWANGNIVRWNTIGAGMPVWVVRTVQQGPETEDLDKFTLLVRGDVDAP
jgi:hypothetical protein